jgi:hypothetical protein
MEDGAMDDAARLPAGRMRFNAEQFDLPTQITQASLQSLALSDVGCK